jgi:hypothetical protein
LLSALVLLIVVVAAVVGVAVGGSAPVGDWKLDDAFLGVLSMKNALGKPSTLAYEWTKVKVEVGSKIGFRGRREGSPQCHVIAPASELC